MADLKVAVNPTFFSRETLTYSGSAVTLGPISGVTTETAGGSFGSRFAANFGGAWYVFQGQGIWKSSDNGGSWGLVYTPPSLTAANNARFGLIILTLNGSTTLCAGYGTAVNNSLDWILIKSTNGEDWDVSPTFRLGAATIRNPIVYKNDIWALNNTGTTTYQFRFDMANFLAYSTTVSTTLAASTTDYVLVSGSGILDDGIYIVGAKTTSPRGAALVYVAPDTSFPFIITPSVDAPLDETADGAGFYHAGIDAIYYIDKKSAGLGAFKTNSGYTAFTDVTSAILPAGYSTNINTTTAVWVPGLSFDIQSSYLLVRTNASNAWDQLNWSPGDVFAKTYLAFGNSTDYVPAMKTDNLSIIPTGTWTLRPNVPLTPPSIQNSSFTTGLDGVIINYQIYSPRSALLRMPLFWAPSTTGVANNPMTLSATSQGSIAGNTITAAVTPGYTTFQITWNNKADDPTLIQSNQVSSNVGANLTQQRREESTVTANFVHTF